jgi:tetratricopeptide (TPR) repeat protein
MDLNHSLFQLENAQLVRRLAEDDLEYIFKHTLTQESVYGSMLKARRAEIHREVAEVMESFSGAGVEQDPAVLALHFERAGVDDKAFAYAALAGDSANRAYAHQEALDFYARATAIARRVRNPEWNGRVRTVYSQRGRVLEVSGDHLAAMENYKAMMAFAREMGDVTMEADGLVHLLTTEGIVGHSVDPKQYERALTLARQSGDSELVGRALWNIGLSIRFRDPKRSTEFFRQTLEHAHASGLRELAAYALLDIAGALQFAGTWRRSNEYSQKALEEFRALDNKPMIANSLAMLAEGYYTRGEAEPARAAAEEGARVSHAIENPWGIGYNEWVLLQIDLDAGEFNRVLANAGHVIEISQRLGISLFVGLTHMVLARMFVELGQFEQARSRVQVALRELATFDSTFWSNVVNALDARILLLQGHFEQARAILARLWNGTWGENSNLYELAIVGPGFAELAVRDGRLEEGLVFCDSLIARLEAEEMFRLTAELYYERGLIQNALGNSKTAELDLRRALSITEQAQDRLLQIRVHAALEQRYLREGDREHAHVENQCARSLVQTIVSNISDPALRKSFLERQDLNLVLNSQ